MNSDNNRPAPWHRRVWDKITRKRNLLIGGSLISIGLFAATLQITQNSQSAALIMAKPQLDALAIVPQNMRWGFAIDEFQVEELELRSGDILGDILLKRGLTYPQIQQLVDQSKGVFNITSFRMGKNLNFLTRGDEAIPQFMIYEPSPYEYILFNLREPFTVEVVKRDVQTEIVAASGVLETNFWQTSAKLTLSRRLSAYLTMRI